MGRYALEHHRCCNAGLDEGGVKGNEPVYRGDDVLGVSARALVDVYEVDPGSRQPDTGLTGTRLRSGHVFVAQNLRPAVLVYPDGLHTFSPPTHRFLFELVPSRYCTGDQDSCTPFLVTW